MGQNCTVQFLREPCVWIKSDTSLMHALHTKFILKKEKKKKAMSGGTSGAKSLQMFSGEMLNMKSSIQVIRVGWTLKHLQCPCANKS